VSEVWGKTASAARRRALSLSANG